jgi:hypothetical protein
MPAEAAAAWRDSQLTAVPWQDLSRQLQACVDLVNQAGSSQEHGPPGLPLLAAAPSSDLPAALLALAPVCREAVTWADTSGRRLAHIAAEQGSAAALEALLSGGYASSEDIIT